MDVGEEEAQYRDGICRMERPGGSMPWQNMTSSSEPALNLAVVIIITILVGILYILIYAQLMFILYRKLWFMLISYQTVFLFVNLLWASLRLTLYTFYFASGGPCCDMVFKLPKILHWLLVNFPTFLQFFSLALLVHYFAGVLFRSLEWRFDPSFQLNMYRRIANVIWVLLTFTFLIVNVTFGLHKPTHDLLLARLLILEIMFLVMAVFLSLCILVTYTTRYGRALSEVQSTLRKIWAVLISLALSFLFISRCIYNIVSVVHSDGWKLAADWNLPSDQANYEWNSKYGFVTYLIALIFWEVIPTYLVVLFFRVKLHWPKQNFEINSGDLDVKSSFFFSNPRRYDSVEGDSFPYQRSSQVSIPQIPPSRMGYSYGSFSGPAPTARHSINSSYQPTGPMPGTTPPRLFAGKSPLFSNN